MTRRRCPACGADEPKVLGAITAEQVAASNSTYRPDALRRLGLEPQAPFEFARCRRCRFVYALILPSETFLRTLYNDVIDGDRARFESQSPDWMGQQLHLAALLLKRFNGAERIDILDYGCGYGTIVRALGGSRVSGCGFEPTTVVAALRSEGLDATDSLEELRSRGPFNGIILSDVLEHLPEPRETLKICHSLMRPGGWICVSVPYFGEALSNAVFDALRRGVVRTRELNPWEHLNYFSPTTLSNVLEGSGFAVDATVNPDLGFRSEARAFRRWGNAVKSAFRMFSFAAHAHLTTTTALARRK